MPHYRRRGPRRRFDFFYIPNRRLHYVDPWYAHYRPVPQYGRIIFI